MELSNLIPTKYKKDHRWVVGDKYLMFKKFENIPLISIRESDEKVMLYLDHRLRKECVRIIEHLMVNNIDFVIIPPYFTNPKIEQKYSDVIEHYLYTHSEEYFFYKFREIGYDLVDDLVKFCQETDTMNELKEMCENFKTKVNSEDWSWYSNQSSFIYKEDIRNEFNSLYRTIRIKTILS